MSCNNNSDFSLAEIVKPLNTNEEIVYGNPKRKNEKHPKCNDHQQRIPVRAKDDAIRAMGGKSTLMAIPEGITDFEGLYRYIKQLIGAINGIGGLAVYDVAVRIGAKYGIFPCDFVYLHAGPMVSAKYIESLGLIKLPRPCSPCVPIGVFSRFCPGMSAVEIEINLCIKKASILKLCSSFKGTIKDVD